MIDYIANLKIIRLPSFRSSILTLQNFETVHFSNIRPSTFILLDRLFLLFKKWHPEKRAKTPPSPLLDFTKSPTDQVSCHVVSPHTLRAAVISQSRTSLFRSSPHSTSQWLPLAATRWSQPTSLTRQRPCRV